MGLVPGQQGKGMSLLFVVFAPFINSVIIKQIVLWMILFQDQKSF